jgi:hypothetical protein
MLCEPAESGVRVEIFYLEETRLFKPVYESKTGEVDEKTV